MSTFADFALLRAVPSYGGAEVLLAQRVREHGEDAHVHLALYGDKNARRLASHIGDVAEVAGSAVHDQVARIHEVGIADGALYAVADAQDGIDVASLLELDRRRRALPDLGLSLGIALQLGQLGLELTERSDVWAAASGCGLSSLFPAGLRLDGVVLTGEGRISVRPLAGAALDPKKPSAFRPPEWARDGASVASDVFVVTQVLRALLTGDASATSAPRLAGPAAMLGPLLAAGLSPQPDERIGLFMLLEKITGALSAHAPKTKAHIVVERALAADYDALMPDFDETPVAPSVGTLRARLKQVRATIDVVWPRRPGSSSEFDDEPSKPTALSSRTMVEASERSDAVDRVFTAEADVDTLEVRKPPGVGRAKASPVLDIGGATFSEEPTTQNIKKSDQTLESDSEPPWVSDVALVEPSTTTKNAPAPTPTKTRTEGPTSSPPVVPFTREASSAPRFELDEIESGPTVQTRAPFDDDEDDEKTQ